MMKQLFFLSYRSLLNRKVTTGLTVLSIALGIVLLVGLSMVRKGTRQSFHQTISQTDLIVGARGGSLSLLLYTLFHMGYPTNNIHYDTYQHFANHPLVKWTIPFSLGDSHRGFRVVGTTQDFYTHYRYRRDQQLRFREGHAPRHRYGAVLGHDVAKKLQYTLGSSIIIAHGLTEGVDSHDDHPFKVVGILDQTHTPIDRSVYVTLEGIEAIHVGWEDVQVSQLTSFLVRTHKRIHTLTLQRQINTYTGEPLTAIVPGFTLHQLWQGLRYAEDSLQFVALCVVLVSLLAMVIALYTTLTERRREMAILRAIGAGPRLIFGLFLCESFLLTLLGTLIGVASAYGSLWICQSSIEQWFGIYLPITHLSSTELTWLGCVIVAGVGVGVLPAWRAYRASLHDGLTVYT